MTNIVLIGMPGAGKTTLGKTLAQSLGLDFVDTDTLIEEKAGISLQEILENQGLEGFKTCEGEVVASLHLSRHVIATGGSVVYSSAAMKNLKKNSVIIYIDVPPDILEKRVHNPSGRGMVRPPGMSLQDLFRERKPLYEKYADLTISDRGSEPEELKEHMIDLLKKNYRGKL